MSHFEQMSRVCEYQHPTIHKTCIEQCLNVEINKLILHFEQMSRVCEYQHPTIHKTFIEQCLNVEINKLITILYLYSLMHDSIVIVLVN